MLRSALLLGVACLAVPASAETLTTYHAASGQGALALEAAPSALPGAKPFSFDVGVGSALFRDPSAPANTYYSVSDRGPNFTCEEASAAMGLEAEAACPAVEGQEAGSGRLYPTPDYNVSIFELTLDPAEKTFTVSKVIPLKTTSGLPVTGLTNPLTMAETDKPRNGSGQALAPGVNAIDAEGLVRLADGRFFIAEENATGIVEVSAAGVILRRFVPAGTEGDFAGADYSVSGSLPALLAKRNSNRGFESLSISDDGTTLYALVQNPLANPDTKAYGNAVNTRLLALALGGGGDATTLTPVAEYVYQLDDWNAFAALGASDAKKFSSLRISEMTSLGGGRFLVDERTDQVAKLFEITLDGATNILGSRWDDAATSPSLEQTTGLAAAGITPVVKTERLVASSLEDAAKRYPAKIEGMTLTAGGTLLLINDNDFRIGGAETRMIEVGGLDLGLTN